jgi:hypothetical protein
MKPLKASKHPHEEFNFHFKTETFLWARFHSFARTHAHRTYICVHNYQLLVYYIYVLAYVKELYLMIFHKFQEIITNRGEKSQKNRQKTGVKFLV